MELNQEQHAAAVAAFSEQITNASTTGEQLYALHKALQAYEAARPSHVPLANDPKRAPTAAEYGLPDVLPDVWALEMLEAYFRELAATKDETKSARAAYRELLRQARLL